MDQRLLCTVDLFTMSKQSPPARGSNLGDLMNRAVKEVLPEAAPPWQRAEPLWNRIITSPIIPTIYPDDPQAITAYAETLIDSGYMAMEILARPLDAALPVMRALSQWERRGEISVGIGTMNSAAIALEAVDVQPDFLVSPAFSPRVLEVAVRHDIPYIPAVRTFQDLQNVIDAMGDHRLRPRVLKLCPVFGLTADYIRALCGCFPGIRFCPTGEITLENYLEWMKMDGIVAPMGSGFVPASWILQGDAERIRERLRLIRRLFEESECRVN